MKPVITPLGFRNQSTILLISSCTIDQSITLEIRKNLPAQDNVLYLLPERLSHTEKHLACADNMLTLFSLLCEFRHFLNRDIFAFQRIKLQVNFINEIKNTRKAVFQTRQTTHAIIRDRTILIPLDSHVGAKQTVRIGIKDTHAISHSR